MPRSSDAQGFRLRIQQLTQRIKLRAVFEMVVVGVCTVAFALNAAGIGTTLLTDDYAGQRDFVTYWSAGRQLVQRADPYDGPAILRLERSVGYSADSPPLIMRNAPPSLPIVLPLGFLGVRAASLLWSLLMVASLWLAVRMIAAMHERRMSGLDVIGLTFAPALSCLISGQMALFVLLGLVLFLRLHRTWPILAGASLWLCALKPQLFLPFGVVLLAWIVVNRGYRILLGAASAFGLSTAVACVLDPPVWVHYARMMRAAQLETKLIPCVSTMLRHRPRKGLAPGRAGGPGLRLGAGLLPATPPLGLDRAWLTSDARFHSGGPLLLVHGPGGPAAGAPARLVPEPLAKPGGPARAAERGH